MKIFLKTTNTILYLNPDGSNSFMKIYNSNDNLKNFVKNPTHSVESQKKVFEKILALMNFHKIIKNFFQNLM